MYSHIHVEIINSATYNLFNPSLSFCFRILNKITDIMLFHLKYLTVTD